MKKVLFISGIVLALTMAVKAQQLPMYSQYMFNGFLLNPAEAGTDPHLPIRLTARQQWLGIEGAPQTMAISGHGMFTNNKMGVGGYIFHDQFGPVARTGLLAAYAYHMNISVKTKLALGISLMGFQYQLKSDELKIINAGDPGISGARESAIVPDANFGARVYDDRFFVGVAATQLIEFKMKLGNLDTEDAKMVRHYFGMAGYKFVLSKTFELEPSVLVKATERTPVNIDGNIKVIYDKKYWLGASFRSDKEIIAMLGIKLGIFYFGYAFDYGFNDLYNYARYGSHEVMLGVDLKDDTGGDTLF